MPVRLFALLTLLTLPPSSLAVWLGDRWETWWRRDAAPAAWTAPLPVVLDGVRWQRVAAGVEWGELRLAGTGEAHRIRLIVARLDPRLLRFRLDTAFRARGTRPGWSVDRSPSDALLAINAGQFPRLMPWGWMVLNGREYARPGRGPLSVGIAFDSSGGVRWLSADSLANPLVRRGISAGFQSYPILLADGMVPAPLRQEGRGVDLSHRDARAALGQTPDGSLLIALSRFDGAGGAFDFLPFGLTVPEMAAVMGALGARNAVLLDGGISSQLLIRDGSQLRRWRGLRAVPMGLVVTQR